MTFRSLVFMPWWGARCHGREFCGSRLLFVGPRAVCCDCGCVLWLRVVVVSLWLCLWLFFVCGCVFVIVVVLVIVCLWTCLRLCLGCLFVIVVVAVLCLWLCVCECGCVCGCAAVGL